MTQSRPTLAIIGGTGALGSGLALRAATAGYPVVIGSRTAEKAADAARALRDVLGARAQGCRNAEAAKLGEVLIVAIPWADHGEILDEIKPYAEGKLVIDTTVPLVPPSVSRVHLPAEGSAAVAVQRRLGDAVRVVSAFHNVPAKKLSGGKPIDCDVLVFGNEPADREIVISLAKDIGLRGLHAGALANSVAAEALTSVLIGINRFYKADGGAGIRITGVAQSA